MLFFAEPSFAGPDCAVRTLTVETALAPRVFTVEIADSLFSRMRGLMGRESLPEGHGMLFLYDDSAVRTFWMKNTPLNLDLIFFDKSWRIVSIRRNAQPYSLKPISSTVAASSVLEIEAGTLGSVLLNIDDVARFKAGSEADSTC